MVIKTIFFYGIISVSNGMAGKPQQPTIEPMNASNPELTF